MVKIPINFPYVVNGKITDSNGDNPSGVTIVVRNDRSVETITVVTNASGEYTADLLNLSSGYLLGDSITVIARFGLEDGEGSFTTTVNTPAVTVNVTTSEITDSSDTSYCTIQEIYDEMDNKTTDDISAGTIRSMIIRSEAEIDMKTKTSFKSNTVTQEEYDTDDETVWTSAVRRLGFRSDVNARVDNAFGFNLDTMRIRNRPVISITTLERNTAGQSETDSWGELDQQTGSGGDFHLDKKHGLVHFVKEKPYYGKFRSMRVTYLWGLDRTSTDANDVARRELAREICILLTVRRVLTMKGSSSQFDSQEDVRLESISISSSITQMTTYIENITRRIDDLWTSLGVFNIGLAME